MRQMCRHILNAQASIRAACCKRWFDCPECHKQASDHEILKTVEIVLGCKKCKRVFRKDTSDMEEADNYCPHCDNLYVLPAETPESRLLSLSAG